MSVLQAAFFDKDTEQAYDVCDYHDISIDEFITGLESAVIAYYERDEV